MIIPLLDVVQLLQALIDPELRLTDVLSPTSSDLMPVLYSDAPVWRRSICNGNSDNVQPASNLKDDDNYYEISDFAALRKELSPVYVKPSMKQSSLTANTAFQPKRRLPLASAIAQAELVPAFPVTHPPPRPPGSANSSQTGGYYSSASSLGAPSSYASPNNHSLMPNLPGNRGPVLRKQSMSSRTASVDEEDDGFYDNIQVDEKRFSHGSELDNMSIDSHRKRPISKPIVTTNKPGSNRIGQFLRKISASKPPISAASLVSLNKVASEIMPTGPIPLMKSSSLSHYPWKKHVVQNVNATASYAAVDKRGGLGQRLKNSIFGSKKRLS
uniref:Uncharacterized protein n=1 Tax=Setaria digitata TaxID=48799 RepID=A0A915PNR6_9BILA